MKLLQLEEVMPRCLQLDRDSVFAHRKMVFSNAIKEHGSLGRRRKAKESPGFRMTQP